MYDISVKNCQCEQTTSDKEELSLIYPHNDIHFVLSGKGYHNGKLILPGEGFICRRNKFETYVQDKLDPWNYFFARLAGSELDAFFAMFEKTNYTFTFELTDEFIMLAKSGASSNYGKMNNPDYGKAFFNIISQYIDVQYQSVASVSSEKNRYVEDAKSFIKLNYWTRLTVGIIANELHINPDYLRTLFQKYEGISTQEYLLNYRIKRAKALLELREFKITSIASSVGYENPSQFSKLFKQKTGLNPTEYRKSLDIK